ncbi:MAG: hypothetical protein K6G52_04205 [Treponemataceae bacterium]|nr:hypothetical protein [Treponemataceae bacterium]
MSGLTLSQNQSQQQKLSLQMIQSVNLLSEPSDVLRDHIYSEVEKNPALEIVRDAKVEIAPSIPKTDTHYSEKAGSSVLSDNFQSFLESSPEQSETLQTNLLRQLSELPLGEKENRIGKTIIQNLDDKGYHVVALDALFPADDMPLVEAMLEKIHQFDPVGVAVKNLQESLYVQAKSKNADEFTLNFIKNFFELLNKPRINLIQKNLMANGVESTPEQIENAIEFIKTLEPFPARNFASGSDFGGISGGNNYISPDVRIKKTDDGDFQTELIKTNLPTVRLNEEFASFKNQNEQMKKAVQDANTFLTAIEIRNQTLIKTVSVILNVQKAFFEKGPGHIKPLRMVDVAQQIDVHETTVSRIANGKYLICEWGTYPLKYFFSNAVSGAAGSLAGASNGPSAASNGPSSASSDAKTVSATDAPANAAGAYGSQDAPANAIVASDALSKEAVKTALAQLIAENDAKNPGKKLSDQKLCDLLAQRGIHIARRTVAKYRTELNLNSSYDR